VQIRNMATLGGNLANASPAAETATPLLALDAELLVADQRARRKVPLAAFYTALRKSVLAKALIVEIVIPIPPRAGRWSFQKLGRTESDISLVNATAGLQLDSRGRVKWARIALGAVASTPIRIISAEVLMAGNRLDDGLITAACDLVEREVRPITDVRASAEYRRAMSGVLTRRALQECADQLAGCPL
jgi:carbon-monoxide dehydrogenase medium subunit